MHTDKSWLKDDTGRSLIVRGVNLSGSSKVPAKPDGSSHLKETLIHYKDVSFVNKPFPLEEADEHLSRLKSWGLTFIRFLVTWEAIEHKGPGVYDEVYLDYLESVIEKAAGYSMDVFIDPHNDMWSRWTGGDGAPGWTMELLGMDITKLHSTGAAILHSYYEGKIPKMIWTTNQFKLGTSTMFTLFFGGNTFAPNTMIDGEPVMEYLQNHYIEAIKQVAFRLRNHKNVVGYETLNEPFEGFIGHKNLSKLKPSFLRIGPMPTPFESMQLASGYPVKVPVYEMNGFIAKIKKRVIWNPGKIMLWKEGYECIWKQNGIWTDEAGKPRLLKPDYFYFIQGKKVDFEQDYLKPFMIRFLKEIRSVKPRTIIFLGSVPGQKRVSWSEQDGKNVVNADHWYDVKTLFFKKYTPGFSINPGNLLPALGKKSVMKSFVYQLHHIKKISATSMGNIPTLIGEVGIPYDMNEKKAYSTGDFSLHTEALDLYFDAMDENLLSYTIWNYTPDNTNEYGDLWNEEDLSIFSRDRQNDTSDINSGGRAVSGFCRPYARKTAGEPLAMSFDLKTRIFTFRFLPDPDIKAPTEIFVPPFQYPDGFGIRVHDGRWEKDPENYVVYIYASGEEECQVVIKPTFLMCYQL